MTLTAGQVVRLDPIYAHNRTAHVRVTWVSDVELPSRNLAFMGYRVRPDRLTVSYGKEHAYLHPASKITVVNVSSPPVFVCSPCAAKMAGTGGWHCGACSCCP